MTFAPQYTTEHPLSNQQRLISYRARRIEHDIDADIDGYAMTAHRVRGVKVGQTSLARSLDKLEVAINNLDRSYQQRMEVPCE